MDRKQFKTAAHATVKKHYLLLLSVCLCAVMFNVEFSAMPSTVKNYYFNLSEGIPTYIERLFLQLINGTPVGHLFLKIYSAGVEAGVTFRSSIPAGLLACLVPLVQILLFIFLFQIIRVILRRIFLEARTYDKVPLQHALYLVSVKKWAHAAMALFEYTVYLFLWNLTIIGGVIKYYSYFCTPFILAENPSLTSDQAITLSRKMMNGHKKEAFLLDFSLIGWYLLSLCTAGIAGIFYTNSYITAVHSEYYVYLRTLAKQQDIENSDLLNDTYLFEKADEALLKETYKSTRMDEMYIADTEIKLSGARKFFAEHLSLWFGPAKQRKVYQGVENLKYQLAADQDALNGKQYPNRLNPLYTRDNIHFDGNLNVSRTYTFPSLVLLFFLGSFTAWLMQGAFYVNGSTGAITKFGVLMGPWMPMFGVIGILSLLLFTSIRKHPAAALIGTVILAGVIEYATGSTLANIYQARWWSYTNYYLNINGQTCLQSMIAVALICMLFCYIVGPLFDQWLSRRNPKIVLAAALVLLILFALDAVHAYSAPNTAAATTLFICFTNLL